MRLKILRTVGKKDVGGKTPENPNSLELPAKPDGTMYQEGEVANFSKEDAEKFIKTGMGEETDAPVGPPPKPPVMGAIPVVVVDQQTASPAATPKAVKSTEAVSYADMTLEELHHEATERQIEGRSGLDKPGLIKAIEKDDKAKGKK